MFVGGWLGIAVGYFVGEEVGGEVGGEVGLGVVGDKVGAIVPLHSPIICHACRQRELELSPGSKPKVPHA